MKISNTQDQEFLKTLTVLYVEDVKRALEVDWQIILW